MPRLSIIIPHRQLDQRLEATLLSVLENRPAESEIIIVHDGGYSDPYDLADEAIFIQVERGSNTAELLNAGVMAACAPFVCVLLDGTCVGEGWSDAAVGSLQDPRLAAIAVPIRYGNSRPAYGIDPVRLRQLSALSGSRVEVTGLDEGFRAPALACGFYRRRSLLAVGGWNETLAESAVDVELAWTLHSLGLGCKCEKEAEVRVEGGKLSRRLSWAAASCLASLGMAHGGHGGWAGPLKSLLSGLCQGHGLTALAWAAGQRDASTIRSIQVRVAHAKQQLAASETQTQASVADMVRNSTRRLAA